MALIDRFDRTHTNLRISVTDRCNIRCFYCMPEDAVTFGKREELLSFEEIERVARVGARLGVDKIRVTGGEPLLRRDLPVLLRSLIEIPGIKEVSLTTNGVQLGRDAASLAEAGLQRINVHLDTLDRERFRAITRRDEFNRVMAGIDAAQSAGMKVKLNAVALKGITEEDVVPLVRFGRERDIEVRFIEFMPLDSQGIWDLSKVLTADDMIASIEREIGPLAAVPDADPRAPATEYRFADGSGTVGFIASVSRPFCLNCNRLRLTADGKLRYCLFAIEETDVRDVLRSGASDIEIAERIQATVRDKWLGHQINRNNFVPPPRPMYAIGG